MNDMSFGVSLWPQYTRWEDMLATGLLVEELGYDYLWTSDHFVSIVGDPGGPNLECWQILGAWGAVTKRVRLGALVTGNTYRHPAVVANMVATLDHITHGRAILGLGAGWFEPEHTQYGIEFGTPGARLARLSESCHVIRSLLDNATTSFTGNYYRLTGARCEPKPVQARLPILIGGGGEHKTLHITAKYADMWSGYGSPEQAAHKLAVLQSHCAAVGRLPGEIETSILAGVFVRPRVTKHTIRERELQVAERNRLSEWEQRGPCGTVEEVAQLMAEYWRAGIQAVIVNMPPPYDRETMSLLALEVRPRLRDLIN